MYIDMYIRLPTSYKRKPLVLNADTLGWLELTLKILLRETRCTQRNRVQCLSMLNFTKRWKLAVDFGQFYVYFYLFFFVLYLLDSVRTPLKPKALRNKKTIYKFLPFLAQWWRHPLIGSSRTKILDDTKCKILYRDWQKNGKLIKISGEFVQCFRKLRLLKTGKKHVESSYPPFQTHHSVVNFFLAFWPQYTIRCTLATKGMAVTSSRQERFWFSIAPYF